MKKIKLLLMTVLMVSSTGYSVSLLSVDFESDTVGLQPAANYLSPSVNTVDNYATVVNSGVNVAGTGNGLRMYDNSGTVGTRVGYDFSVGISAIRCDISFSQLNDTGIANRYFSICVTANGDTGSTAANRYVEVRITDDGDIRWYQNGILDSVNSKMNYMTAGTAYVLTMYVNDSDSAITGYQPGYNLAANSADLWLDGVYQTTVALSTISASTTSGPGRVGIISGTSDVLMDYVFDNIKVSTIEPPSESGVISLYMLGE